MKHTIRIQIADSAYAVKSSICVAFWIHPFEDRSLNSSRCVSMAAQMQWRTMESHSTNLFAYRMKLYEFFFFSILFFSLDLITVVRFIFIGWCSFFDNLSFFSVISFIIDLLNFMKIVASYLLNSRNKYLLFLNGALFRSVFSNQFESLNSLFTTDIDKTTSRKQTFNNQLKYFLARATKNKENSTNVPSWTLSLHTFQQQKRILRSFKMCNSKCTYKSLSIACFALRFNRIITFCEVGAIWRQRLNETYLENWVHHMNVYVVKSMTLRSFRMKKKLNHFISFRHFIFLETSCWAFYACQCSFDASLWLS